jgi:hypothetical protein
MSAPKGPGAMTVGSSGELAKVARTSGSKPETSTLGSTRGSPNASVWSSSSSSGSATYSAATRTASCTDSFGATGNSCSTATVLPTVSANAPSGAKRTASAAWKIGMPL